MHKIDISSKGFYFLIIGRVFIFIHSNNQALALEFANKTPSFIRAYAQERKRIFEKIKRLTRERERKRIFKNNSHYKLLAPLRLGALM
ncbi:hypothetical protein DDP37_08255 [Helicobacter pylori]|nr:hypothetical protein DDP37_08255 [Helicobacter pylori]